jgi:hypothetical protein
MSVEMVQSALLITVYEYGHGIFQSAFLSVGICVRMAHALGWHMRRDSSDEPGQEEERCVVGYPRVPEVFSSIQSPFIAITLHPILSSAILKDFSK